MAWKNEYLPASACNLLSVIVLSATRYVDKVVDCARDIYARAGVALPFREL